MIKKCKGTGKAKGHGCGKLSSNRTYGLCMDNCFKKWLYSTPEGNEVIKSHTIKAKKETKKIEKEENRQIKRESNEKKAMNLADTYFSRYIRLFNSIDGKCTCYTCGTILPIKEVDNGHYIKRANKSTRFDLKNCKPQCKKCNGDIKYNGKEVEFRIGLVNEYGLKEVEALELLRKQSIKADAKFYLEIADEYREKVNELQKKLCVKYW